MPKLIGTMARTALIAGTATSVSNRVARRQHGRWAEQTTQQANQAPAPTNMAMTDKLAQLQQLGELKAQGILTAAEFEAQKEKILAS